MSESRNPALGYLCVRWFVKMLSIKVAGCEAILEGSVIDEKKKKTCVWVKTNHEFSSSEVITMIQQV